MTQEIASPLDDDVLISEVTLEDLIFADFDSTSGAAAAPEFQSSYITAAPEFQSSYITAAPEFQSSQITAIEHRQDVSPTQTGSFSAGSPSTSSTSEVSISDLGQPLQSASVNDTEAAKRKKNRDAAKQSRLKKKQQENTMKNRLDDLEKENKLLKQKVIKYRSFYLRSLSHLQTRAAFQVYLRQNQQLLQDPDARPVLQQFLHTSYLLLL